MVRWGHDKRKRKRTASLGDRMTDHLMAARRARDRKIAQKLRDGYRPRLDEHGNVILVKVNTKGGRHDSDR